jgi:hypothetical protein
MSLFHRAGPAALAITAAAALALGAASPAVASPHATGKARAKPRASFSFRHDRISDSAKPVVKYTSANLPSGARLELQRTYGTSKVWKDVTGLSGHSGTKTIPAVQLGRYSYRIKVYRKGKTIVFSATKLLYSYGRVTLADLCNEQDQHQSIVVEDTNNCDPQTVQVGSHIFTYLIQDEPPGWTNTDTVAKVSSKSSCRSISLQFALDNNAGSGDQAYVQVIQSSADPQNASVGEGAVGSAYFTLSGSPWYLQLATSNAYSDNEYVDGYLSCWSPTGLG